MAPNRKFIKIFFNNGSTSLLYNNETTVDDIIKTVIKGKLSLNELRFKNCFRVRATRYTLPNMNKLQSDEFDRSFDSSLLTNSTQTSFNNSNEIYYNVNNRIEEFIWWRNNNTIQRSIQLVFKDDQNENMIDYWK
jgi:hypothetical protein